MFKKLYNKACIIFMIIVCFICFISCEETGYDDPLLNQLGTHYLYVAFECNIYTSSKTLIKSCSLPATVYNLNEIPTEPFEMDGTVVRYYYTMDLYQNNSTAVISYVNVKSIDVKYRANVTDNWITPTLTADNYSASGVSGLPTTGTNYNAILDSSLGAPIFSMDYLIS